MPKKLYILVVSSIFFTISDIFFSISCIFPKISCMYLLYVLDIQQQVFLSETARHRPLCSPHLSYGMLCPDLSGNPLLLTLLTLSLLGVKGLRES